MSAGVYQYPIHTGTEIEGGGEGSVATFTPGEQTVTGLDTFWNSALMPGDLIFAGGHVGVVKSIEAPDSLTLAIPWTGPAIVEGPYVAQRWLQHTDGRWIGVKITEYFSQITAVPVEVSENLELVIAARTAAEAARDKSEQWATKTDGEVEPGEGYGAKKYAQDSAASAGASEESNLESQAARQAAQQAEANAATWAEGAGEVAPGAFSAKTHAERAASSETAAAGSATAAAGSASAAAGSATAADDSADAAAASNISAYKWANETPDVEVAGGGFSAKHFASKAAASFASFDTRYLGAKADDPTADNQGAALVTGAFYFNSTTGFAKFRTAGGAWASFLSDAPIDGDTYGRKNGAWVKAAGAAQIQDTAPAAGDVGTFWWSSLTGQLAIRYNDGDTTQWVGLNGALTSAVMISDAAPTSSYHGLLWWSSLTGELMIRYNDGDTEQWVSAFGGAEPAVPRTQIIEIPVATASVILTIPDDIQNLRITGAVAGTVNSDFFAHFSYDGTTFAAASSGAGSYWRNFFAQQGSQAAPTFAYATEAAVSYLHLVSGMASLGVKSTFDSVWHLTKVGEAAYSSVHSVGAGIIQGVGAYSYVLNSRTFDVQRPKKIRFMASTGNIAGGSRLLVEMW